MNLNEYYAIKLAHKYNRNMRLSDIREAAETVKQHQVDGSYNATLLAASNEMHEDEIRRQIGEDEKNERRAAKLAARVAERERVLAEQEYELKLKKLEDSRAKRLEAKLRRIERAEELEKFLGAKPSTILKPRSDVPITATSQIETTPILLLKPRAALAPPLPDQPAKLSTAVVRMLARISDRRDRMIATRLAEKALTRPADQPIPKKASVCKWCDEIIPVPVPHNNRCCDGCKRRMGITSAVRNGPRASCEAADIQYHGSQFHTGEW